MSPNDYQKKWDTASRGDGGTWAVKCVQCESFNQTTKLVDGIGNICKKCYFDGKRCNVLNCEQPSIKKGGGQCREHYIGGTDAELKDHIWTGPTTLARCADWSSYR